MKKIFLTTLGALALVIACQSEQTPVKPSKEEETPQKEEDTPKEEEVDPVMKVKSIGAYNIEGQDYIYRKGEYQLSRFYSADGRKLSMRMLDPVNTLVYTIDGILSEMEEGQNIALTFTAQNPDETLLSKSYSAKFIGSKADTLWLKTSGEEYFVLKK